jgi:hypothetical protein
VLEEEEESPPQPWARLVSLSPLVPQQDLFLEQQVGGGGGAEGLSVGIYTLGRSKKCSIVFKQKLISNEHCRLYCLEDADGKMCPYIEDSSANGTYVNKSTRLKKGRLLFCSIVCCIATGVLLTIVSTSYLLFYCSQCSW